MPGKISSSILRADITLAKGRSSSEENIWTLKGDSGQSTNTSDGIEEDFELIPRGKIQKVVEFSTSRVTKEPDDNPMPITEQENTERP